MARPSSRHPTDLELAILKVLWREGGLPVRAVRDHLATGDAGRQLAHTSVITILNIMVRKGYARRTKEGNAYVFHPLASRQAVTGGMLDDLVHRVFDGSASTVMLSLLETTELENEEIHRLRRILSQRTQEHNK